MHKYQSLDAWKHAHAAVLATLKATRNAARDQWAVFDQLRRAIVSVEANIVEGYALGTGPLFRRHLRIALGSAAESECLVRIARDMDYLSTDISKGLEEELDATTGCLVGLMRRGIAHRS